MAKSRRTTTVETRSSLPAEIQAATQRTGDTTAAEAERDRIAARAYELYQARGGSDGLALEDWLAAERELREDGGRHSE